MEDNRKRYAINFDLEQKKLREYLDKNNPERAYGLLRTFLKKKGFMHVQGSGYNSEQEMSEGDLFKLMLELDETFEWFGHAVKSIQATEIGERYDYTEQFKDVAEEEEIFPAKMDSKDKLEKNSMEECMKRTAARISKKDLNKEIER